MGDILALAPPSSFSSGGGGGGADLVGALDILAVVHGIKCTARGRRDVTCIAIARGAESP